jgi:uncharacterized protein YpmB
MDRKGWIVIITCILLMGVNFYYMQENQKLVAAQRTAEEAKKKAELEAAEALRLAKSKIHNFKPQERGEWHALV